MKVNRIEGKTLLQKVVGNKVLRFNGTGPWEISDVDFLSVSDFMKPIEQEIFSPGIPKDLQKKTKKEVNNG